MNKNMLDKKIGFIGAGNMAEAMTGALAGKICNASQITLSDISEARLDLMKKTYGVNTTNNNFELFSNSDVLILAVKPQNMNEALSSIAGKADYAVNKRKVIISIAAGIPIKRIENILYAPLNDLAKKNLAIVRVMPNTPALVLCAMSGVSFNAQTKADDKEITRAILESMGKVIEFDESYLDGVTGMSGSGPAYVFYFIEAMIEAGCKMGFSEKDAKTLSLQTFKGAIKLLEERGESPQELRRKVTSPNGTTEAAIKIMEKHGIKQEIIEALEAATNRSKELSA